MRKTGRNQKCPCGSGLKFKRCHGRHPDSPMRAHLKKSIEEELKIQSQRSDAKEIQRRLMQGAGKPIISVVHNGTRFVAVGSRLLKSQTWLTFTDFLMDYMSDTLGGEWGNAEIAKLEKDRHPLIKWYQSMCLHQKKYIDEQGKLTTMPMNGAMRGYIGLAYDLYLIEHNIELPRKLIARLKDHRQFEGALYEAYVIGRFAKAGFEIELEDEDDPTKTHSEFIATHRVTGRKFAVEAKSVSMTSSRAGKTDKPVAIRKKLHDALKKEADYPRIVFVEISRSEREAEANESAWMKEMVDGITEAERNLTINGDPAPSAYLFITNRPFVHDIEALNSGGFYSATGFKIDDFPFERAARSVLEMHQLRQKHIEPYALLRAFQDHWDVPQTFDERLPAEAFGNLDQERLLIGNSYLVPNGSGKDVPAKLLSAVVMEQGKNASGIFRLHDGTATIICQVPLSDAEMELYHQSPGTFFGEVDRNKKSSEHPLELFDFFFETYSKSTRENLLNWMASSADYERLERLSQIELAEEFCAGMAESAWRDFSRSSHSE
ncbi:MAG: SEC-C domain-containing protein [Phyllobacteriaceae bacterium]|nr:SEC-C domain-containing protein [Phyllobacteriaceae bacterium]